MKTLKFAAAAVLLVACAMAQEVKTHNSSPGSSFVLVQPPISYATTFNINGAERLVSIDMTTGKITYGPNYTPDKAAEEFWQAVAHKSPNALEKRIRELEAQLAARTLQKPNE